MNEKWKSLDDANISALTCRPGFVKSKIISKKKRKKNSDLTTGYIRTLLTETGNRHGANGK